MRRRADSTLPARSHLESSCVHYAGNILSLFADRSVYQSSVHEGTPVADAGLLLLEKPSNIHTHALELVVRRAQSLQRQ